MAHFLKNIIKQYQERSVIEVVHDFYRTPIVLVNTIQQG